MRSSFIVYRPVSLYRPLLRSAWTSTIRNRRRWWLAIVGGLLVGSGWTTAILQAFRVDPIQELLRAIVTPEPESVERAAALWEQASATGAGATAALSAYAFLVTVSLIGLACLAIASVNALIASAAPTTDGMRSPRSLFHHVRSRFWATFTLHIGFHVVVFIIVSLWGAVLARSALATNTAATLWGISGFVVTTAALTVLQIVTVLALVSAVIDRRTARNALADALSIFHRYWVIALECAGILSIIHAAAIFAWIIGSSLLSLPFFFLGGIAVARGAPHLVNVALGVGLLVLTCYLIILLVLLSTFLVEMWTNLYIRLTSSGREPEAWITRAVSRTR